MKIFRKLQYLFYRKRILKIKDYVEGNLEEKVFFDEIKRKKAYNRLSSISTVWSMPLVMEPLDSLNRNGKFALQSKCCSILNYFSISFSKSFPDLILWEKWKSYIPSFIHSSLEIMDEMEKVDPKQKHTKKWHKERIREEYPFKRHPPRWLQSCEWPIDEGKKCMFLYQTGNPDKDDCIEYHFIKSNGEKVVITQYS